MAPSSPFIYQKYLAPMSYNLKEMGKKDYHNHLKRRLHVFKIERIFPRHSEPLTIRSLILGQTASTMPE